MSEQMNGKSSAIDATLNPKDSIGVFSTTMIAVAYGITLNNFTVGAGVEATFKNGVIAALIAWVALAIVWTGAGLMGQMSKFKAADIFKYSYGRKGYTIPSFCILLANCVWAIFDYWYVGSVMRNMMPNSPRLGFVLGMIIITSLVIVGIIKDITSLKWLTTLTVPIALVMFVIIFVTTLNQSGGWDVILNYKPTQEVPLVLGINAMFASFTAASPGFADIGRNCTSKKCLIIGMPLGMLIVCFQYVLAMMGKIGLAASNLTSLALILGGSVFYITNVFIIFGQVNTCSSSSFVIVNQAIALFSKIPKKVFIFAQPLFAMAMAFAVEYGADITILNSWVSIVACIFGPLIGVLFAEFFIVQRTKLDINEQLPNWAGGGIISTAVGFVVCVYFNYFATVAVPVGFVGILLSGVLHIVLRKCTKMR